MFAFGNDYSSVYNNLLATQQADVNQYNRFADMARQDRHDQIALDQAQEARDAAANQWRWKQAKDLADLQLSKASEGREERKLNWQMGAGTPAQEKAAERKREFDFSSGQDLAHAGTFDASLFPNLAPQDKATLEKLSKQSQDELGSIYKAVADDADLLNYHEELKAAGGDIESKVPGATSIDAEAAEIKRDKKRFGLLRKNQQNRWEPVTPRPNWVEATPQRGGFETAPPEEMEQLDKGAEPKPPWYAGNLFGLLDPGKRALALRNELNPPPNPAWGPPVGAAPVNPFAPPPTLPDVPLDSLRPKVSVATGKLNAPQVGEVRRGYQFLGGNPADPASWQKQ